MYARIYICKYIWAILEGVVGGLTAFLSSEAFTNHLRKTIETCFEKTLIDESKNSHMNILSHIL